MTARININSNDDFEKELQAYLQHMQQELSAAQQLIEDMEQAGAQIAQIEAEEANDSSFTHLEAELLKSVVEQMHGLTQEFKQAEASGNHQETQMFRAEFPSFFDKSGNPINFDTSFFYSVIKQNFPTYYAKYEGKIAGLQAKVQADETKLEAIDPNINGTLINQLNELMENSQNLLYQGLTAGDSNKIMQQTTEIFKQLCSAIMATIQQDLAMEGMKKFGSDPNHAAAILQFAGIAIQAEFQEQSALQNIQTDVINDVTDWYKEKSDAEADLKTGHWYDFFTGGGPDSGKDHAEIRAAEAMINILNQIEKGIAPLIETIDPGMQEFTYELQELKAKFQQYLNGHGTIQEIKDAMVAVLSILVAIIAETTKDAAMYDKEMNQASQATSQMNLNDSLSQQEVIDDAKKYASIMGGLLDAAKYIGMAVIFLLNPGVAMALMVALDAALTATGVMDKLQNALADKLGDIGGAIATCGIEVAGTAGGSAAIEGLIEKIAIQAAAQATEAAVAKTIEEVVAKVTESALKSVGGAADVATKASTAAEEVATKAVTEAVTIAQQKVANAFLSKTVTEFITSIAKGNLKVAMETAAKEAAENAGKEIQVLADTAAKQGSAAVIGDTEIESIAKTAATKAVADALKITEKAAAQIDRLTFAGQDLGEKTTGSKALMRGSFTALGAMGSTGLMIDFTALMQHKDKKDLSEGWQTAMEVIQALLQFIGTLGASDIAIAQNLQSGIPKALLGLEVAQGGMQAIGSAGEAAADFQQAGAVRAIAKDQSTLDMMQFIIEQLRKDGQIQRDQYTKEMQKASETNMSLAMHFNDANQAVAEAMSVLAV